MPEAKGSARTPLGPMSSFETNHIDSKIKILDWAFVWIGMTCVRHYFSLGLITQQVNVFLSGTEVSSRYGSLFPNLCLGV